MDEKSVGGGGRGKLPSSPPSPFSFVISGGSCYSFASGVFSFSGPCGFRSNVPETLPHSLVGQRYTRNHLRHLRLL